MRSSLRRWLSWQMGLIALPWLAGCGNGTVSGSGQTSSPPSIQKQPADVSEPMGLAAMFAVQVSGTGLSYQWYRNGVAIPGATSTTYTTAATMFSDSGAVFTVTAVDSVGTVTSSPATLTVTARAPIAGDLRFGQVDSAATVNGYTPMPTSIDSIIACPPPGGGFLEMSFGAVGGSFELGNNACWWPFFEIGPSTSIQSAYGGAEVSGLESALAEPIGAVPAPDDPRSVLVAAGVTSAADGLVAFGYTHDSSGPAYTSFQATVSAAAFPAAAAAEAAQGHVITAFYAIGSNVTYFSYAWAGDPNGVYETTVVSGTLSNAASLVSGLAAEGFIVTASTSTEAADGSGLTILGTRVKGDTAPRPFLEEDGAIDQLEQKGYAPVVMLRNYDVQTGQPQALGER